MNCVCVVITIVFMKIEKLYKVTKQRAAKHPSPLSALISEPSPVLCYSMGLLIIQVSYSLGLCIYRMKG